MNMPFSSCSNCRPRYSDNTVDYPYPSSRDHPSSALRLECLKNCKLCIRSCKIAYMNGYRCVAYIQSSSLCLELTPVAYNYTGPADPATREFMTRGGPVREPDQYFLSNPFQPLMRQIILSSIFTYITA